MKRIGLLLGSLECNLYMHEVIRELSKIDGVEFHYLISARPQRYSGFWEKVRSKLGKGQVLDYMGGKVFQWVLALEYKVLSASSKRVRTHFEMRSIEEFKTNPEIYLTPLFSKSGTYVRYSDDDITKLKSLKLDIILRVNSSGIYKGGILNVATNGLLSFHHGDNRWNRGGPAAFWEVYLKKPSTGFIVQVLSEDLDGGSVLFRGNIPTLPYYLENLVQLYHESYPHLTELLVNYTKTGALPPVEEGLPFSGLIHKRPGLVQSLMYFANTVQFYLKRKKIRTLENKKQRWGVAFIARSWREANLSKGIRIPNPANHFYADPFVVTHDKRTIIFIEDYLYKTKKGCITAIEILDDKNYEILGPVIDEEFHLSFPYIFEFEGVLYMVPETKQTNSIRLYKCVSFPLKWRFEKELMKNISAVDAMLFKHGAKWWLMANVNANGRADHCSKLNAYYADSPITDNWSPHALNPVVYNSSFGRNGGILDLNGPSPVRVRQRQDIDVYGAGMSLSRLTTLTPSSFEEKWLTSIEPEFFDDIIGCHHMHGNENYTVFDYVRNETTN